MVSAHVLQLAPVGPLADPVLAAEFGATQLWRIPDPQAWIARHDEQVQAVVTSVRHGCSAGLIGQLPRLRAICSWGVGVDTIAVDAAVARGIQVSNTPDVLNDCVADLAWALLLAGSRRIVTADRHVREGHWHTLGEFGLSSRVSGKRLGILGLGRIGHAIAQRGRGFGMDIRYHGRTEQTGAPYRFEPSLTALAAWCDFLIVACVGGPSTRHLVDRPVLDALGPRGMLVNIARGSVIDQPALILALQQGRLGGAGLDVFEGEPGAPEPLRHADNVVLTPHMASATLETRQAMEQLVLDNLRAFLATGQVITPAG